MDHVVKMARWRVDIIRKRAEHLGTVEAATEKEAIEKRPSGSTFRQTGAIGLRCRKSARIGISGSALALPR
jgi:hypothetical protein